MKKSVLLCALAVFTLGLFSQANAAKVSAKEKNTKAMIEAIEKDNVADVIKYVKDGADVNVRIKEKDNTTPIFYAVAKNYKDLVKLLLSKGSDINAEANDGYGHKDTPLTITIFAQQDKSADMVKFLLENGADANYNTGLPLMYAIQYGGLDTVKALVEGGADVNINIFEIKTTPLHVAVYYNKKDIVEYLVSKGADIYAVEENTGYTPFHYAVENYASPFVKKDESLKQKQKEVFEFLLAKVDNIDMPNAIVSPLYLAAYTGDKEVIEALLAKGTDINRENKYGTPIYAARDKETVEFLISKGAEVKYLRPAIILGDLKLVKKLVKEGDDLNRNINYSDTPLILALEQNQDKIAKYLISQGADVNLFSSYSPLSIAVSNNNAKMVKYLIAKGADINKQDKYVYPALFYANNKEIAKILIKNGADVNAKNYWGKTPLDLAQNEEVKELLTSKGAKNGKDLK